MISESGSTESMLLSSSSSLILVRPSTLSIMYPKLENYGFSKPAFRWIASYLSGRQQIVKGKNGSTSSFRLLNTGVPQGSVLGPLLFSLYINDIRCYLDPGISHILYADDLRIYAECHLNDLESLIEKMSDNAKKVDSKI